MNTQTFYNAIAALILSVMIPTVSLAQVQSTTFTTLTPPVVAQEPLVPLSPSTPSNPTITTGPTSPTTTTSPTSVATNPTSPVSSIQPVFSIIGVQNVKTNEAVLAVAFDSNGANYLWETQPKISVVYTHQSTGATYLSGTVPQWMGTRTTSFPMRNLKPDTTYSYKATMNYNGVTKESAVGTFKTLSSTSLVNINLGTGTTIPTGYPTFSIQGVRNITTNEAVVMIAFDSRDGQYSWNNQPKVSISYTNRTTGESLSTISIGQSQGSRTTTFSLRDLKPDTKYSYKGVMYYAGTRYETAEQIFTTAKTQQYTVPVATNTSASSTIIPISFFGNTTNTSNGAVVEKTIGVDTTLSNLESIIKTGGYGNKNGVALAITNTRARVTQDEVFEYNLQYHNANNKSLRSARIVVSLPDQYTFDSGDGNTVYSNKENMVTIYLGTIAANESGSITFKARPIGGENTKVETKAMLVYTGGSVSAVDRDTYAGGSQSVLGATVFGSGFFPQTFFGWLVVIVVLVIIMIATRRYMTPVPKKEEEKK